MEYYLSLVSEWDSMLFLSVARVSRYCRRLIMDKRYHIPLLSVRDMYSYLQMQRTYKISVQMLIVNNKSIGKKNTNSHLLKRIVSKPQILLVNYTYYIPYSFNIAMFYRITSDVFILAETDNIVYLNVECDTKIYLELKYTDKIYINTNGYHIVVYIPFHAKHHYHIVDMPSNPSDALDIFNLYNSHIQN